MADITADLATAHEEVEGCHPLLRAQSRLPRKVVQVCHQTGHEVLEARIGALRVYEVGIGGDVVDGEVEERRSIVCRGHFRGSDANYVDKMQNGGEYGSIGRQVHRARQEARTARYTQGGDETPSRTQRPYEPLSYVRDLSSRDHAG
jgi:hypothetical protein